MARKAGTKGGERLAAGFADFDGRFPAVSRAYEALGEAVHAAGPLTDRERRINSERKAEYQRELAIWQHRRKQYEAMTKSIEQHLVQSYGGSKATLTRVEHRLLAPFEVRELGMKPSDPSTYVNLPESPAVATAGGNR